VAGELCTGLIELWMEMEDLFKIPFSSDATGNVLKFAGRNCAQDTYNPQF
jgi:hypothetical protein